MDLVRDLLDKKLVDRRGRNIGRVDGLVLELRDGRPSRLVAIELGAVTLVRRLHPRLAAWLRALGRWSPVPLAPIRLSPDLFRDVGVDIELDVDASTDRDLLRFEKWLSRHVVARIPGGKA